MNTTLSRPLVRLHALIAYDRSAKARWLLTELGVPFEDRWLNREEREFEKPEYLKLNPMGRVPVAEIGDQVLFESGAICAYLADRFGSGRLAPTLDSPERAEYEQWLYFAASTLDPIQGRIMIIEDIPAGEIQKAKESALLEELRDAGRALSIALENRKYLVADRFSAADICVSYHLYWLTLWPELKAVLSEFSDVMNYLERLKSSVSAVKSRAFSYDETS